MKYVDSSYYCNTNILLVIVLIKNMTLPWTLVCPVHCLQHFGHRDNSLLSACTLSLSLSPQRTLMFSQSCDDVVFQLCVRHFFHHLRCLTSSFLHSILNESYQGMFSMIMLYQYFVGIAATYQKLELEKKKSRAHRQTYFGPFIRYHSVTVPAVDENAPEAEINVDTFDRYVSQLLQQLLTGKRFICNIVCSFCWMMGSNLHIHDLEMHLVWMPRHGVPMHHWRHTISSRATIVECLLKQFELIIVCLLF